MIGVGDVVVCVDDAPSPVYGGPRVRRGSLYRVASVYRRSASDGIHVGVTLVGVDHEPAFGFKIERFRKVEPADAGFRALIAKRPLVAA